MKRCLDTVFTPPKHTVAPRVAAAAQQHSLLLQRPFSGNEWMPPAQRLLLLVTATRLKPSSNIWACTTGSNIRLMHQQMPETDDMHTA